MSETYLTPRQILEQEVATLKREHAEFAKRIVQNGRGMGDHAWNRDVADGRAIVEEVLAEWERVTSHFASRSQSESDDWQRRVNERTPRAAKLRAFLAHIDTLTAQPVPTVPDILRDWASYHVAQLRNGAQRDDELANQTIPTSLAHQLRENATGKRALADAISERLT